MRKPFTPSKQQFTWFRERCDAVCQERARRQLLTYGWRQA